MGRDSPCTEKPPIAISCPRLHCCNFPPSFAKKGVVVCICANHQLPCCGSATDIPKRFHTLRNGFHLSGALQARRRLTESCEEPFPSRDLRHVGCLRYDAFDMLAGLAETACSRGK